MVFFDIVLRKFSHVFLLFLLGIIYREFFLQKSFYIKAIYGLYILGAHLSIFLCVWVSVILSFCMN